MCMKRHFKRCNNNVRNVIVYFMREIFSLTSDENGILSQSKNDLKGRNSQIFKGFY